MVVPYCTCELASSLVVQVIVAPLEVVGALATKEITGAVVSAGADADSVANEWPQELVTLPAISVA